MSKIFFKSENNILVKIIASLLFFTLSIKYCYRLPVVAVDNELEGFGRRQVAFLLEPVSQL